MTSATRRILLVPDSINGLDSGAQSARATLNYLQGLGHLVAVYSMDAAVATHPDVRAGTQLHQVPTQMRWYEFLHSPALIDDFRGVVQEFRPEFVFFVGSIQKPAVLAREARRRNIRTVYLFYINDYFCPRVYAGRENGPCLECMHSPLSAPLRNGCFAASEFPKLLKSQIVLRLLGKEIRNADKVLGYGQDQLDIARQFGVSQNNLAVVGFQFDPRDLVGLQVRDDGYFVITGQPIVQKGWHLLPSIFARLQSAAKFKISFRSGEAARQGIDRYGLREFVDSGRIEIVTGLGERSLYLDFLASSRGVVLPSYYPTTGEFVLQESMFLCKPVHVFDVGVHKDILVDQQNAMVSAVGDVADYAWKIDEIERNQALRASVALGAKRSSDDFYSNAQIELLNKVFE